MTQPIEIRIANVDLASKLDAIGALIAAVREAHRDEMSHTCWANLNMAQESIAAAMLCRGVPRITAPQINEHLLVSVGKSKAAVCGYSGTVIIDEVS